jgi:serine/threonine protein kinase
MHRVGVGHLDVKPSNVILRRGEEPVLVDFGLAGRHIRPGCGTGAYEAPEVWGAVKAHDATPMPADVYAAGCLVYEALSGEPLFDQKNEVALVAAHLTHDGWPPQLKAWYKSSPELSRLSQLLAAALRREPAARVTVAGLRQGLSTLAPALVNRSWPLGEGN